jgi:hypothetical protein
VLTSPDPGSVYRISDTFNLSAQQIQVQALAGSGLSVIKLYVDGVVLGAFSVPPYQVWWTLAPGPHQFWAEGRTPQGEMIRSAPVQITVLP